MTKKLRWLTALACFFLATSTFSDNSNVLGVWQTEPSDVGYLHVAFEECDGFVCGTILQAFNLQDELADDYADLGKTMVWDMKSTGDMSWGQGRIWDPTVDKTYKSKMSLKGDVLSVSGCILFICKGQDWTRVR